jgi:hypothetical protein
VQQWISDNPAVRTSSPVDCTFTGASFRFKAKISNGRTISPSAGILPGLLVSNDAVG